MPTNKIGVRTSNVFLPYTAATKRTKQLDISAAVTGNPTFAVVRAQAIFYADSSSPNVWRMNFNIEGSVASGSRTGGFISISTVTFKSTANAYQAVAVYALGDINGGGITIPGSGQINYGHANFTTTGYSLSGDVELNAEPTTYTTSANMEGVLPVDVWVPSASATVAGIVDNAAQQLGSGIKTVSTDGLKFANATGSYTPTALNYYEEGSFSVNFNTGIWTTTTSVTVTFVRVGKVVTLYLAGVVKSSDATSNFFSTSSSDVPTRLRPSGSAWVGTAVYESSNFLGGFFWVSGTGVITFQKNDRSNFAATGNGYPGACITYLTA